MPGGVRAPGAGKDGDRDLLSGRLRGMKFMKRKAEANMRKRILKERQKKMKAARWTVDTGEVFKSLVIIDDEDMHNSRFMHGRRSFGGFNPVVVSMNSEAMGNEKGQNQLKTAVSDEEMTRRFNKFVGKRVSKGHKSPRDKGKSSKRRKGNSSGEKKTEARIHSQNKHSQNKRRPFKRPKTEF
eukprot:CAMPEP_0114522700 /NCGR_PEP_ID=MMETSP0109-20121206/20882_1 /TAXON_ID=29199 /ORGANISM="Chlorarachnion reptans, Strain CCCM449" /LENGTH=182 /DNA_ID=CAMNT_0001703935 /DNA_START=104 /DNA_END=652 /DNA_ORIENTATION=+